MRRYSIHTWTWYIAALAIAGLAATCAGGRGAAAPGITPAEPLSAERRAREREAERIYRQAEAQFAESNFAAADSLAEGIVQAYDDTNWLGPALLMSARVSLERNQLDGARGKSSRYLRLYRASDPRRTAGLILVARTLWLEGQARQAADSLLATPAASESEQEEAAQLARQVVGELGLGEIDSVTSRWPADHPLRSVFEVERASLLLAAGATEQSRAAAEAALELDPLDPERERASKIVAGELETEQWRPIVGAILPLSGALAAYGRLAEEGIRLAIEEYNRRHYDEITLVVRDDGDVYRRDGDLVRELERLGAVAIIGPLRAEGLEVAAESRRDRDLVIISPTALENYSFERNTFSLWSATERVTRGARALGAYAVFGLQVVRFGVMYPNTQEGRMQFAAFSDAVRARGGVITASIAYEDTATTFEEPLTYLRGSRPQAVYAPASTPESVIQLAPQFSYYGLRGVQVLGNAEWSAPKVQRLVEERFINGTVVSTFLDRQSPAVRWSEFVEMYERKYRKGLEDNLVPALAYDATRLVLAALPWGFPRRSAIARSVAQTRGYPGATGVFTVENGVVTRRSFLLQFKDGLLVPALDDVRADRLQSDRGSPR
ncbi:MAG: ABC transporter substrate-binding protein [Gemmatimonadota bacterium]|nr:MAG: ABC transporter substrate-binding protein [Gemmatimonadota bacterium]